MTREDCNGCTFLSKHHDLCQITAISRPIKKVTVCFKPVTKECVEGESNKYKKEGVNSEKT